MKYYRGKMIDTNNIYGGFKSREEIDTFYKNAAIRSLKIAYEIWEKDTLSYEALINLNRAEQGMLANGFTYEEVEALEIEMTA